MSDNWGKLFKDITVQSKPIYAVGRTGFIDMSNGEFIAYDDTFSEEFFDNSGFVEVGIYS